MKNFMTFENIMAGLLTGLATLLFIAVVIVLVVLFIFFDAYLLQQMWMWFIVPLGVMKLNLFHACGFGCLKTLLFLNASKIKLKFKKTEEEKKKENKEIAWQLVIYYVSSLLLFLLAYVCHLCM